MPTTAAIGHSSQFARGNGGTPEVFTALAQVTSISPPSLSRDTIDASHMQSPQRYREFVSGMRDGGEVSIELDFERGSTTDVQLLADFNSDAARNYRIVFPSGQAWTFNAFLTGYEVSVPMDDKMTATATFKVNGIAA